MRKMYSENQVKEIVNKGIESGEIPIPSGGTQLYQHKLIQTNTIYIIVIDTIESNIASGEIGSRIKQSLISQFINGSKRSIILSCSQFVDNSISFYFNDFESTNTSGTVNVVSQETIPL